MSAPLTMCRTNGFCSCHLLLRGPHHRSCGVVSPKRTCTRGRPGPGQRSRQDPPQGSPGPPPRPRCSAVRTPQARRPGNACPLPRLPPGRTGPPRVFPWRARRAGRAGEGRPGPAGTAAPPRPAGAPGCPRAARPGPGRAAGALSP